MRLHQPTGIWLLLLPCWWGIALASEGMPSPRLLLLFAVGAAAMRGAGCIVNDWWDRDFDRQVERTKNRPLASGELNSLQAGSLLALLCLIGLLVVTQLPPVDFRLAVCSLALIVVYPLMKRVTWWPQAFLGLTFNWGALMGYAAVRGVIPWPAALLYIAGFFWTLAYDTIYAFQDARDDVKAGVKSTALRLQKHPKAAIGVFYLLMLLFLGSAGFAQGMGAGFYVMLIPVIIQILWLISRVRLESPRECLRAFRANALTGLLAALALVAGHL
jgi:4-hydroxybenzoate polyprenyltransferase